MCVLCVHLCGHVAIQGLIVLPGVGVKASQLCLMTTIALVIGALVGAALATAFAEVAVVTAGFLSGGLLGYALFIVLLQSAMTNALQSSLCASHTYFQGLLGSTSGCVCDIRMLMAHWRARARAEQ